MGRWTGTAMMVVISSPSGGGKTTVINALRRKHPEFLYSVSVTTRAKRAGERNGTHYFFATEEQFARMRDAGQLVEWATVHDKSYGTPRANVERAQRLKRIMLFDLDVQGAASLRHALPGVVSIFLLPTSMSALVRRLKGRRSESPEAIARRLETARTELSRAGEYDYLVTNDDLKDCIADCEAVIRAEMLRRERHPSLAAATSPA
ncbi:MAG TPA: guanylate kinase [bacterium]|nr:guanylate kinase [bacterium]